jgi:hypothetical protein
MTKFSHPFHCHYYIRSQKYHSIHSLATSYNTTSSLTCIFLMGTAIIFMCKNSNPGQLSSSQHLPVTHPAKSLVDFLIFHMILIILLIKISGLSKLFIRCHVKSVENLHSILAILNAFHEAF